MRIGIDITSVTPSRTGVGNYTFHLLKHMMEQNPEHSFHGFASGAAPLDLRGLPALASRRSVPIPTRSMYRIWSLFGRPRIDRLLGGVDVYHATNYFLPPVASARTVVTFHDLAFMRVPELCSPKIVRSFSRGAARFVSQADAVIACSEATKRDLLELLDIPEEKIAVIYEAAGEAFVPIDPGPAARYVQQCYGLETPYIVFLGTLEPRKNVDGLLRAFAMASEEIPHSLVLVGNRGWNMPHLEERIAGLGIEERVMRLGYVESVDHIANLFSAASAFVFPSFYEGFGLPVLEAMSCGCPVICSDRASLPEVGGDAAEYIDPDDTEEMAATLRRVLMDDALLESMRERGLMQARRFSWDSAARSTLELYSAIV